MKAKGIFLGTGASAGIPVVGCHCSVCTSSDQRNKRLRPSLLLNIDNKNILIDAGPDHRMQALNFGIKHVEGVIITHTHYDHIGGLDDLRVYYILNRKPLPLLLSRVSYEELKKRLPYLFLERHQNKSLTAQLDFQILEEKRGAVSFLGLDFHFMTYEQGGMEVNGFRIGSFAYVSDIKHYPETIFEDLKGVKTLILSALRIESSHLHFSLEEACIFAQKLGATKTYLMHVCHELDHEMGSKVLPNGVELAYDGLSFECET